MAAWKLGQTLESLRGDLTQAELGRRIGVSRERMGQIERGRVKWPEVDIFNALSRELGVPVSALLRAAGADIPTARSEELDWLASQLDDEGLERLAELGRALLPRHRRRPGTAEPPPPSPPAAPAAPRS